MLYTSSFLLPVDQRYTFPSLFFHFLINKDLFYNRNALKSALYCGFGINNVHFFVLWVCLWLGDTAGLAKSSCVFISQAAPHVVWLSDVCPERGSVFVVQRCTSADQTRAPLNAKGLGRLHRAPLWRWLVTMLYGRRSCPSPRTRPHFWTIKNIIFLPANFLC